MSTSSPSHSLQSHSHYASSTKKFIDPQFNSEPVLSRSASASSKKQKSPLNLESHTQTSKTPDRLPNKHKNPLSRMAGRNYSGFLSPAKAIYFQSTANESKDQKEVKEAKDEIKQTLDKSEASPSNNQLSLNQLLDDKPEVEREQPSIQEVKRHTVSSVAQQASGMTPADLRKLNTPNKSQEQFFQSFLMQQFEAPEEQEEEGVFEERKVKSHGFYRPFHPFQIASWVIFALDCFLFLVFSAPSAFLIMPSSLAVVVITLSVLLMILILALSAIGSRIDPTDPIVYQQRKCKAEGRNFPEEDYQFYCNVCKSHVSDTAKHCGQCNRCVSNFDHHCNWLNNCVGRPNYRVFIGLIWSVCAFTLTQVSYALGLLTFLFINPSSSDSFYKDMFKRSSGSAIRYSAIVFCFASIVLNVLISLFIFNLIFLHIFLRCKKLTTFEYIMLKREREEQQMSQNELRERKKKRKVIERKMQQEPSDQSDPDSIDKVYKLRNQSVGPLQITHGRSESDIDLKLVRKGSQKKNKGCCFWKRTQARKSNQVEPLQPIEEEVIERMDEEVIKASSEKAEEEQEGIVNHSRSPLDLQKSPQVQQEQMKGFTSRKPSVSNFVQSCSMGEPDTIFSPISKSVIQKMVNEGQGGFNGSMADMKVTESLRSPAKRIDRHFSGRKGSGSQFGLTKKRNSKSMLKQIQEGLNPRSKSIGRKSGIVSVDHHKTLLDKPSIESKFSSYVAKEDDGASARSGTSQKRSRILEVIQIPKRRINHNYTSSSRGDQTPRAENEEGALPQANIAEVPDEDEFDLIEQSVTQEVPEIIQHNLL